ncbi:MAG TPA: antibiotic biosynthesis monooxygenase family protein [Rhodopila sp.]|uniref:putative quinol monooxygenase n=1 Tax=Rhodopila sp. TaxID=2480087 RepID=UPI002C1BB423|nr:antibiotic biosynthesis monooxygenase family protein [Rhodopila sp.]HVY18020.1 antibiotic biosynthesis monooxygenase family protein [Rhodopila sp.]
MPDQQKRAFTVHWIVKENEVAAALDIITRFAPLARNEPGLEMLTVQQSAEDPRKFMFYEIFSDDAAFAAHQETAHFKQMIMEEALPKLSHRERVAYRLV